MKKLFYCILLLSVFSLINANEKTDSLKIWKAGGTMQFNISQISLNNWAAGGQNSLSLNTLSNVFANYKKGNVSWDNVLELQYGTMKQGSTEYFKTDDKIDFSSKYGRQAYKSLYYSGLVNFKTQFAQGYKNPMDTNRVKISDFLSPAYILLAAGIDYKYGEKFSLFVSPLTGKTTLVLDRELADKGSYGVEGAIYDSIGNITMASKSIRNEFGGYIKAAFKQDIMKNVGLQTKLELFSNYLNKPGNVDVNIEALLSMKVNKYISATLNIQLLYDDDIKSAVDSNNDGITDKNGPRLQFKEIMGIGFSYKF